MSPSPFRRTLTVAVAALALLPPATLSALAGGVARFQGRVVADDGATPLAGVVITLLDADTRATFASEPTRDNGAFEITAAPAGSYTLVAETSRGAFLAPGSVSVHEGRNAPVSLSLRADPEGGEGGPEPALTPGARTQGLKGWPKWLIVGGIVVGGVVVLDAVTKDEKRASPF